MTEQPQIDSMRFWLLLLVVLFANGCAYAQHRMLGPQEHRDYRIENTSRDTRGGFLAKAWGAMEMCSGNPDGLQWNEVTFLLADSIVRKSDGWERAGLANTRTKTIYVVRPYAWDQRVVAHEILHLMLPRALHRTPEFYDCDPVKAADWMTEDHE